MVGSTGTVFAYISRAQGRSKAESMRKAFRSAVIAGLLAACGALPSVASAAAITPTVTEFSEGLLSPGPWAIAPGPEGNLWFVQYQNPGRIGKITPTGTITEVASGGGGGLSLNSHPTGIVAGPDGNLWFTEQANPGRIGMVNPTTGTVTEVATGGSTTGFRLNSAPEDITAGPDGNLWFTELEGPGAMARITTSATVTEFSSGLRAGGEPGNITAGPDGNLWFTDLKHPIMIGRVSPGTGLISEFSEGLTGTANLWGITAGPDGNLWFTEYSSPGRIGKVTPSGAITEVATGGVTPGFSANSFPHDIVAGPDGQLWFAEGVEPSGPGRIGRLDPTTGAVEEFPVPTANSAPLGITLGPEGNVWFTEIGADKIGRITTPPTASTTGATTTGESSATVSGRANGHAQSTSFHVEYGPLGGATTTTAEQPLGVTGADTPVSLALTGLHPATAYQARVVVTNPTSSAAGAFVTFTTPPSSPATAPSSVAPVVSSVRESATKWRVGGRLARISSRQGRGKHRPPVGTTFSFSLNEQASVSFAFTQQVSGRKVSGKCLAQTNRNRHKRVCKRTVTRGTLSFNGHSGVNKVSFQGLISRSKKLLLGSYTLVITASSTGQRSTPKQLKFTIVK